MSHVNVAALTDKQTEALALAATHHTNKEIARLLDISPRTVEQRLDAAKRKLGASSRGEAARQFMELSDIPEETLCGSSHIAGALSGTAQAAGSAKELRFHDVYVHDDRAPWMRNLGWPRSVQFAESPSPMARLSMIVGIAVGFVVIVLAVLGVANALTDLV